LIHVMLEHKIIVRQWDRSGTCIYILDTCNVRT
jgi:hypothetical protein